MKFRLAIIFLLCAAIFAMPVLCADEISPKTHENVVFFGDSTTAHMKLRGGIPKERVLSGPANTVLFSSVNEARCVYLPEENRTVTFAEAIRIKKPEILVITLGVSGGAGIVPEAKFKEIYKEMLMSVKTESPGTQIFVQSVLPLSDKSVKHYGKLTKQAVLLSNEWIKQVCAELCVPYINTHPLLADETGYLKKLYQNDEYMHLTSAAYDVIINNIYTFIEKYSSEK